MNQNRKRLSVCIATYNGACYIKDQIISVLNDLSENDELIIYDDCSTDDTVNVVKLINDIRINIFVGNSNLGHVKNFERAILCSSGKYIFLCDQDDIWVPGRADKIIEQFNRKWVKIVVSNFWIIDKCGQITDTKKRIFQSDSKRKYKNILLIFLGKASYFGCTMAFTSDYRSIILPFPSYIEAHDLWIALAGNLSSNIFHMEEKTLYRRIHDNNRTPKKRRSLLKILVSRCKMIFSIITLYARVMKSKYKI